MRVEVAIAGTNLVYQYDDVRSAYVRDGMYVVEMSEGRWVRRIPMDKIAHITEMRSEDEILHTFQSFPEGKSVQISGDPS